jgi:hypothetical protein
MVIGPTLAGSNVFICVGFYFVMHLDIGARHRGSASTTHAAWGMDVQNIPVGSSQPVGISFANPVWASLSPPAYACGLVKNYCKNIAVFRH